MKRGDTVRIRGRVTRYIVRQRIGMTVRLTTLGPGRIRDCQVELSQLIKILALPGRSNS